MAKRPPKHDPARDGVGQWASKHGDKYKLPDLPPGPSEQEIRQRQAETARTLAEAEKRSNQTVRDYFAARDQHTATPAIVFTPDGPGPKKSEP